MLSGMSGSSHWPSWQSALGQSVKKNQISLSAVLAIITAQALGLALTRWLPLMSLPFLGIWCMFFARHFDWLRGEQYEGEYRWRTGEWPSDFR